MATEQEILDQMAELLLKYDGPKSSPYLLDYLPDNFTMLKAKYPNYSSSYIEYLQEFLENLKSEPEFKENLRRLYGD